MADAATLLGWSWVFCSKTENLHLIVIWSQRRSDAMKRHSFRLRQLVSVDNPKRRGTLLLKVGMQNSGGTVCLLAQSKARIGPRVVREVLSTPVGPMWPQTTA